MKFFKTLSKRGLALFLVLTMCMSLLPATAMAAELEEANHTHNEDGWTCVETRELTCEYDEHTHDETCWGTSEAILTCALEESEGHTHGEDCYSAGGASPACGLEEHTHGFECAVSHWDCAAPSDAVKLFLQAVKDIPEEITAEAEETVASARNAYDALDAAEQINASVVKAYEVLANAEAVLEAIAAEEQAKAEAEAEEAARAAALEMIRPFVDAVAGIPETDMISGENFEEVGEYINDVCYDLYMELYGTEYAELDEFKAAEEKFLAAVDRVQELAETVPEMLAADVELTIDKDHDLTYDLTKNSSYRWIIESESENGVVVLSGQSSGSSRGRKTITVTGLKPGTATVAFQTQTWIFGSGYVWSTQKTWTIEVTSPVPATGISIPGSDTVAEFGTVKLNAVFAPAGSSAKVTWSSDDMGVATVDENGTVTGVASGTATISATIMVDGVAVTATHAITVTRSASTTTATFYYLKTPTSNPASNSVGDWGPAIGTGTIDVTGAQWEGINCFVSSASNRVITWPSGYENGVVPKGSTWNTIFDAFKSTVEGGNVTTDDIESITLVPYKISDNDKLYHVDCQVVIKAKGLATATFYLWDAGGSGYVYQDAQTVRMGKQVDIPAQVSSLPAEKTANGRTYRLITWHDNSSLSGAAATFPYTVTGNVNFYAKYVADYIVTYDLDGGNWTANPQTNYEAGKTVTVVSVVPQKAGYTFTGWKTSIDSSVINGGSTFTMPEADVTLTAQWEPDENQKHELTYTVKYFQNDVQVGNTVTVTNEFQ
ncbi:MAG: Ig-like domain-containing protein, partial [Oscillospiraceae bacterium]|nr:Ig-like domain-containing protein [Oscillospiraceae bacterium]